MQHYVNNVMTLKRDMSAPNEFTEKWMFKCTGHFSSVKTKNKLSNTMTIPIRWFESFNCKILIEMKCIFF